MDTQRIRLDFLRPAPLAARPNARHRWCRVVAGRLAEALQGGDAGAVLAAGALAVALVEQERDEVAAARRAGALLDAALIAPGHGLAPEARALLEAAAEALLRTPHARTPADVGQRLGTVLRAVAAHRARPASPPALQAQVPDYLAEHLHEGVRLADLARRLGYSASHCSMLVRRATGERFSALRRRMQLERAIGMLRSGTSVKEAALTAGFSEAAYFSRVFSQRFGVPPSRWREVVD